MAVAAVDRCIRLIETLADTPSGLSLSELASRLTLPKSAVHRMLATLADRGYVEQEPVTQNYAGSLRLATLGFRCLDARHLPSAAQQVLDRLAQTTGEYCRLALVGDRELLWAACAQGATQGLRYEPPMGHAVILHVTASGKAWLSTLPEASALEVAAAHGISTPPSAGSNVVRNLEALRRHLAETRKRGYAIADDEAEIGTFAYALAFSVTDGATRRVAGTISVAGPHVRMQRLARSEVVASLARAAREMEDVWPLHRRQNRTSGSTGLANPPPVRGASRRTR